MPSSCAWAPSAARVAPVRSVTSWAAAMGSPPCQARTTSVVSRKVARALAASVEASSGKSAPRALRSSTFTTT